MKSDTIRRYKNLVFVLIVFSVMFSLFSILSNAAEADGWYWSDDDKILYVKDGVITKRQLYKAIVELHGSTPKAVKYNPQKAPSGWDYGGTTLTSASTTKEELSNGTYVAACRTKDTFAKGREEYEFTVIVYYDLSISVTSGAPDGAGASLSATKVLSGESVMITVNEVAGYKAEITDMSGAPITDTNAYKPSASGELTVTYSILPKYDVTVNTANSEYGTVTLKSESKGVSGSKVLYEIKPLEKTATVEYFIESVSAGGVPLVQDENGYYVYTVGDGDAVIEVNFGKRELLCNSDPTATVHSGMSFEEIQKALFNAVIADSLRAEITENKISFFYYPRKKAAGNFSEESPIAINTPAGADEYSFAEGSGPYITERIRIEWDDLYYETNIVLFDPRPIAGINASDMKFEGKTAPDDIMAKILSRLSATLTDPSNSASTPIILSEDNLSWDKPFAWPDSGKSAVFTVTVKLDGEYAGQNSKSFTLTCQNTTPSYRITFRSENKFYYEYYAFEGDPLVLPSDPERENYEFAGWDPAVSGIVTDIATYKATWIPETDKNGNGIADQEESFTVYWDLDCDGKADDHAVVKYGELPVYSGAEPKKTDPSGEYSFTFVGWDKNIEAVTENITYTAVFSSSKKSYTITWMNDDAVLKTETLEYGSMPSYDGETPTRIDPNGKYTYTFSGWSPEIKSLIGDITYSAQFKSNVNQYTVTWKNYDGSILKTEKVDHGTVPYYTGTTPSKPKDKQYTYTFNGWDKVPDEVTSDIEFTAQFRKTVNQYTVYWDYDGDGKAEDSFALEYGVLPSHFAPNKTSDTQYDYTFLGWAPEIVPVSENVTYTAVFGENVRKYTVSWVNGTEILQKEELPYGTMPEYRGEAPTKIDPNGKYTYTFSGWSPEIKAVTGNITYSAQFKSNVNQYTVTWKNYDGSILKTEKVDHGEVPYYTGATPSKPKDAQYTYTFNGWDTIPTEVTSDIEFTAQFRKTVNKYTVYWDYDGDGKAEDSLVLEYGTLPSHFAPNKTSDTQYDYTFLGWSPEIKPVSENITYTAVFGEKIRNYTVSWVNGTEILQKEELPYGSMPEYRGEIPTKIDPNGKYTYTFSGWSPEIKAVVGDITYSAQFKSNANQYTVTWKNYDGSILKTEKVDHGEVPYYIGVTPSKPKDKQYTYTFNGWDKVPDEVTSDIEFTAQFRKTVNKYTVYWDYDGDGKAEDSFVLEYGVLPSHFAPNKTSDTQYNYTFLGWAPEIKPVSENITYTAVFGEKIRNYTVSWTDGSKVLLSKTYEYGEMPVYDAAVPAKDIDAKYTYSFAGWSPEISLVRGNIVYTAVFSQTLNADSGRIFIDGGAEEFDTKKLIGLKNKVISASGLPLSGNYSVLMVVDDLFGETEHINIETGIEFDALILACRLTVGKALDFIIADNDEGISVRVTMYIADARPTVSISLKEQEITIGGKSSPDDIVGYLSAYITAMALDPASGKSLPIPISDKNIDWCPDLVWPSAGQTLKYTVKISINDKEYAKPAYAEIAVILNNTTPFYTVSYYDGLGGLLAKYRVAEGESAPTPEDPSRSHYSFNGWDTDPPSAVMSDSSHIAVWKLLPHEFSLKKAYEIYLAQPATCSSPALYYMSCECGLAGSETFSFGEKDPSLHASAEFFYTDNKDGVTHLRSHACCSSLSNAQEAHFFDTDVDMLCLCGYDRTHRHGTGSFVSGHAPSCVSELSGRHYYYICSCGDKFYDEDCTDPVINDTDLIIPYRHSTVYHAAVEANCCSFGSAEHFECSICQRLFADSNAFTELFDITIRPSGDHRSAKTEHDAEYHWYICEAGGTVFGKDEHIPNIPYVTEKEAKYCTVCECLLEEKLEHIHRGGQATCLSPAVCEGCGEGYGMLADHDFSSDGICIYCGKEKEGSAPIVTEEITTEAETEADSSAPQTTVPEVTENETSPDTDITEENAPTGDLCPIWMLYALIILFVAIFAFTVKKKRAR